MTNGNAKRLSLGRAWAETTALLRRDGKLIAAVALALLVLPGVVVGLFVPPNASSTDNSGLQLLVLLSGFIGLAGQLAISRIALGPALTVGQAIGVGFRRLPAFFVAAVIWVAPLIVALVILLAAAGADLSQPDAPLPQMGVGASLVVLALLVAFLFLAVRMLMTTPAAAATRLSPVGIVRRSWELSRGHWLKLFGLVVLVLVIGGVLVLGIGSAVGSVIILLLGRPEAGSVSALLVALVQQLLSAVVSTVFAVLVARCFVQLTGEDESEVFA